MELQLGGRLTREHRRLVSQTLYITNEDWMTGEVLGPVIATGSQSLPDFDLTRFTPNVGMNWRPVKGVMLYAKLFHGLQSRRFQWGWCTAECLSAAQ